MRTYRLAAAVCTLLASAATCGATDVARVLNLVVAPRDAASGLPTTSPVTLVLSLYDAPTGGTLLWSETKSVPVVRGIATVTLGDTVPLPPGGLTFNQAYWLGVKVNADPEMTPRIALTPSPYTLGLVLPITARAAIPGASTFSIYNTGTDGIAILGDAGSGQNAVGVEGRSVSGTGVVGRGPGGVPGLPIIFPGVFGTASIGVYGLGGPYGVIGRTELANAVGVSGEAHNGPSSAGIFGRSAAGSGVEGEGRIGLLARSTATDSWGVLGEANAGNIAVGVEGRSATGIGVLGRGPGGVPGILGLYYGVYGTGDTGVFGLGGIRGVQGETSVPFGVGVWGENTHGGVTWGVYGRSAEGFGVEGEGSVGVHGVSTADGGQGVIGEAMTGGGTGVLGKASLNLGVGVFGSGAYGVRGEGPVGVKGLSTDSNGTGVSGEANNGTNAFGVAGHSSQGHGVHASSGSGNAVYAYGQGSGAENAALKVINDLPVTGMAAYLWNQSTYATAHLQNKGSGEVLVLQTGAGANRDFIRAVDQSWDPRFRVNAAGEVYADGAFHPGGADFAEMLPAVAGLEPGDVLVIGPDGCLTKCTETRQTSLAGVYSTKPGVLGGSNDERMDVGNVPLAVMGVVPVKVCGEGGVIVPGDLLTTSSKPGHAMKAAPDSLKMGACLGKALEPFPGTGTGIIKVLVNVG